jgi:hypothetical protein
MFQLNANHHYRQFQMISNRWIEFVVDYQLSNYHLMLWFEECHDYLYNRSIKIEKTTDGFEFT